MARLASVITVCVVLGVVGYGQQQGPVLTFDELFPPASQRAMGLHKLTQAERAALHRHVESLLLSLVQVGPHRGRSPSSMYPGIGGGHWVKENIDGGEFILLEDGSLWKIDPLDKIDAALWLPTSDIRVVESSDGSPGYDYLLINTDDGEMAHAKYIRER